MVEKPSRIRRMMNSSIRETPMTISLFSMGMLVMPVKTVRIFFFMACMPMAASVPIRVASTLASRAITSVV